jgi:serine/threonine protein kinase
MIIGKSAFDSESMDELVDKIEKGTYTIPTSLSREIISFINGMIQYDPKARLSCEELSRHPFLTKDVKDFTSIDMKTKTGEDSIEIDFKESKSIHKSIWAFYKESDEEKLIKISGYDFDKDKKENNEPIKRTNSQEKKVVNNDNNMTPNEENHNPPFRRNTFQYEISNLNQFNPMYNNNFNNNFNNNLPQSQNYGPMLSYPYQRIPGNPVNNVQIMPMQQNSQYVNQVFNDETEYSFGGGIYSK